MKKALIAALPTLGVLFATSLVVLIFFVTLYAQTGPYIEDESVLLKGEIEYDYPSMIYLITEKTGGTSYGLCGATIIDEGVAVTAAHCVENTNKFVLGRNAIDINNIDKISNTKIFSNPSYLPAESWSLTESTNDIAILTFTDVYGVFSEKASITRPKIRCGYEIAAYGKRVQDEVLDFSQTRPKESIDVCITDMDTDLIIVTPESGTGMCFGDSGSPIFEKDTNKLVGIISAIIAKEEGIYCASDNTGIGVRLDNKSSFITAFTDSDLLSAEVVAEDTNTYDDSIYIDYNEEFQKDLDKLVKQYQEIFSYKNEGYYDTLKKNIEKTYEKDYKPKDLKEEETTNLFLTASQRRDEPKDNLAKFIILSGLVFGILGIMFICSVVFVFNFLGKRK